MLWNLINGFLCLRNVVLKLRILANLVNCRYLVVRGILGYAIVLGLRNVVFCLIAHIYHWTLHCLFHISISQSIRASLFPEKFICVAFSSGWNVSVSGYPNYWLFNCGKLLRLKETLMFQISWCNTLGWAIGIHRSYIINDLSLHVLSHFVLIRHRLQAIMHLVIVIFFNLRQTIENNVISQPLVFLRKHFVSLHLQLLKDRRLVIDTV